jgi:sugar phosphate isomerase/epimerase
MPLRFAQPCVSVFARAGRIRSVARFDPHRMPTSTLPIAAQLYTVRELIARDFAGTIREIARIGYKAVQIAGYGNLASAAEARQVLDEFGIVVAGAHVALETLRNNIEAVLDEQTLLGNRNIVCPWLAEEFRSAEGYRRAAETLNRIAERVVSRGFELAYHNHSFEFETFDGPAGMDILLAETDPKLVKLELDVYWLKHGGQDPVAFINGVSGRVLLLHLKDMESGSRRRFARVGYGILDFPAIIAAGIRAGARWGIVEQDDCYEVPPLTALADSLGKLRAMGLA